MSLILDALRKSEAERQRARLPGVHTPVTRYRSERPSRMMGIVLLGAALMLMVAIAWWWSRTASEPTRPDPIDAAHDAADDASTLRSPADIIAALPASERAADAVAPSKPATPAFDQPVVPASAPSSTPASTTVPAPAVQPAPIESPSPAVSDDALPFAVLGGEQRARFPALKYTMHVYGDSATTRFAILDGVRVMEGGVLGPAYVVAIRRDGVVIDFEGQRYLIAKP